MDPGSVLRLLPICATLALLAQASTSAAQQNPLFVIIRNDLYGYVNANGAVQVSPRFEVGKPFAEGVAPVRAGGQWGYINLSGQWAIQRSFEDAEPFSEGRAAIRRGGKWGYIDRSGEIVIAAQYDMAKPFSQGLAPVRSNGEWFYIDRNGRPGLSTSTRLEVAEPFREGLAAVRTGSRWGFIDRNGVFVIAPKYYDAKSFGSGLAPVRVEALPGGRVGYINARDQMVIPARFQWGEAFSEGLAAIQSEGRWGFIDVQGRSVIPPRFALARSFSNGVSLVTDPVFNRPIYINRAGRLVIHAADKSLPSQFGALSLQPVTLRSSPAGASVYMVPLVDWEDNPALVSHPDQLVFYLVPDHTTNLQTRVYERRYVVLFILGNISKRVILDVTRGGQNTAFADMHN